MENKRKILILAGPRDELQRIALGVTKDARPILILFEEEPKIDELIKLLAKENLPQTAPTGNTTKHPRQKKNERTNLFHKHSPLLAKRFKCPRRRG